MFLPKNLRRPIAFLTGFLISGMIVSSAMLSLASLFDTNGDSNTANPRLVTFAEIVKGSKFADLSYANFDDIDDYLSHC